MKVLSVVCSFYMIHDDIVGVKRNRFLALGSFRRSRVFNHNNNIFINRFYVFQKCDLLWFRKYVI